MPDFRFIFSFIFLTCLYYRFQALSERFF